MLLDGLSIFLMRDDTNPEAVRLTSHSVCVVLISCVPSKPLAEFIELGAILFFHGFSYSIDGLGLSSILQPLSTFAFCFTDRSNQRAKLHSQSCSTPLLPAQTSSGAHRPFASEDSVYVNPAHDQ